MALNVAPGTKRRSLLAGNLGMARLTGSGLTPYPCALEGTSLAEGASGYAKPWQASLSFKDGSAAVVQSATSRQREKRRLEKAGNAAAPEAGGRGNEAAAGQVLHSRAAGAATARPEVASLGESVASRVGSATAAAAKHATRPGLGMPMILAGKRSCAGTELQLTPCDITSVSPPAWPLHCSSLYRSHPLLCHY
ncbi:unnamed protein product [Chrysoparadoxa australica]